MTLSLIATANSPSLSHQVGASRRDPCTETAATRPSSLRGQLFQETVEYRVELGRLVQLNPMPCAAHRDVRNVRHGVVKTQRRIVLRRNDGELRAEIARQLLGDIEIQCVRGQLDDRRA